MKTRWNQRAASYVHAHNVIALPSQVFPRF